MNYNMKSSLNIKLRNFIITHQNILKRFMTLRKVFTTLETCHDCNYLVSQEYESKQWKYGIDIINQNFYVCNLPMFVVTSVRKVLNVFWLGAN